MENNKTSQHTSESNRLLRATLNSQNQQNGTSLLDLLIVIVIVGVLVAAAVPQIGRSLELRRLDVESAKVASKLSEARSIAEALQLSETVLGD